MNLITTDKYMYNIPQIHCLEMDKLEQIKVKYEFDLVRTKCTCMHTLYTYVEFFEELKIL